MNRLVIVGAGGHGKVVANAAALMGYDHILFVDDGKKGICLGYQIVGSCDSLERLNDGSTDFFLAIGNGQTRCRVAKQHNVPWATIIHPKAVIAPSAVLGEGSLICAGAVIQPDAVIGRHCIINTSAIIEHDNSIGDFAHIAPGCVLTGNVTVGANAFVGAGAVIQPGLEIGAEATVGSGAVVTHDVASRIIVIGNPAAPLKPKLLL